MTDGLAIDFGRMDQLVAGMTDANLRITAELQKLDSTVAQLEGEWGGAASEAYQKAHREWASSLTEMNRILARVSAATATITERHRETDRKVTGLWQ